VLVAAAVALAACTGNGSDGPERSASDAPTRTTSTTAAPPPGLLRVSAGSSTVDAGPGSRFTGVDVGPRAILVIGDVEGRAAMWTTTDGASFDPVPLPPDAFPAGSTLHDVAVTSDRFVVVGSDGTGAAAWTSPDGRSWVRTDHRGGSAADVLVVGELGVTSFGRDGDDLAVRRVDLGAPARRSRHLPGPGAGPARRRPRRR
jgi:hypothetical protein